MVRSRIDISAIRPARRRKTMELEDEEALDYFYGEMCCDLEPEEIDELWDGIDID